MHILAGTLKQRTIYIPLQGECRPTLARTRGMVFNICQGEIEGASFLDLFAGTGAMGFEALSRGARRAVFVDSNRFAIEAMKKTALSLNVEKECQFLCMDVVKGLEYVKRTKATFDIVYVDPPYFRRKNEQDFHIVEQALSFLDTESCLTPGGMVFTEDAKESPLEKMTFTTLSLMSKRRCGDAFLWQFQSKAALHSLGDARDCT